MKVSLSGPQRTAQSPEVQLFVVRHLPVSHALSVGGVGGRLCEVCLELAMSRRARSIVRFSLAVHVASLGVSER